MTPDDVKKWLSEVGMSRAEFAERLSVSKRTVDNWLSPASRYTIPKVKLATIAEMMEPPRPEGFIPVQVAFTDEEWQQIVASYPPGTDVKAEVEQQMLALIRAARGKFG